MSESGNVEIESLSIIVKEAEEFSDKQKTTILRRLYRLVPYGVEITFFALVIPFLVSKLTGWTIVWPGLFVFVLAIVVRLVKDDYRMRARLIWVNRTRQLHDKLQEIKGSYEELEASYRKGESRLASIDRALHSLEDVLKSDVLARCTAQISKTDGRQYSICHSITPEGIREDLRMLCKFISEILGGSEDLPLRCGILIEDPDDQASLIPIVVYDPSNPTYASRNRYSKTTDFSGQLLSSFESHRDQPEFQRYATHIISDVDALRHEPHAIHPKPITRRPQQVDYIKCIAGNVIYCRNEKRNVVTLGVINIDSRIPNAILERDYLALQPYLFPAFRLLANRLLLVRHHKELVPLVWNS